MATETAKKLFTVDDYFKMVDAGILRARDRVELIRGEVLFMSPIGPRHTAAVDRANRAFVMAAGDKAIVRIQGTVILDDFNAPEPDVVLLRPKDDFYASKHAGPNDILLVVEVADSSLEHDRNVKLKLYAEMGLPEYWISNLQSDCLVVYSELVAGSYSSVREVRRGETISPKQLSGCLVRVEDLLP